MQHHRLALLAAAAFVLAACNPADAPETEATAQAQVPAPAAEPAPQPESDPLRDRANAMFTPIPERMAELRGEPLGEALVSLGHQLYFEPRLSRSHIISCNTCHSIGTGGADNVPTSIGHGWQKGPRNAPTVLNAVFNAAQFWDGRAADLAEQAKGPVQAAVEMNNTPERAEETLRSIPAYVEAFRKAFPGQEQPVTFDNMATAIEAFEAQLLTPDSRFDRFLAGKEDLAPAEREGLQLFMDKGCTACHSGINLGGQAYFPFGLVAKPSDEVRPAGDKGRFAVTQTESDEYVFRAAPLRNVALTAPYFHSGQVWDLADAVAIMGDAQLGQKLNADEVASIVSFLGTLTGRQPNVEVPILPPSTAATPKPE